MCALLKIENAVKVFDVARGMFGEVRKLRAVDGVSLTLEPGQSLGLVGESGCGKSTLGRLACGFAPIRLPAISNCMARPFPGPLPQLGQGHIQMVFQDPASLAQSAHEGAEFIAEPLVPLGIGVTRAPEKSEEMLDLVGLAVYWRPLSAWSFPAASGKGIAIARALITHPEVIVCDEPVSALDASVQAQILSISCGKSRKGFRFPISFYLARSFALLALCASIFP